MIHPGTRSQQPLRAPWSCERLEHERAIALGQAIDNSTWLNYNSALNSYLDFVKNHHFPVDPTPDTLSFYVVYMSSHIKPDSVDTYLSGISQQLEPFFPLVRAHRKSALVRRTLDGCKRMQAVPTQRKHALSLDDLQKVIEHYHQSKNHDDLLFVALLLIGFFALMRLGELTNPDNLQRWNPSKVIKRASVSISNNTFEFFLPSHKADRFFEGNTILLMKSETRGGIATFQHFASYLQSRDHLFPFSSPLWLRHDGTIPTRSFFMDRLHQFFSSNIGGQSMRAGGATTLAANGTAPSLIQAIGRWSSDAFRIYIRKNPVLIQALLHARDTSKSNYPV